jgi:hypothetical protein
MHWIVQDNLYREDGYLALIDVLQRFSIPHDIIKVIPFTSDLPDDQQTIPHVSPVGPVMVCGSTTLANIAKKRGWTPGSFHNAGHDYRVWRKVFGRHLLNADARVCRFADVAPIWNRFFIRPCEDNKAFSGQVYVWDDFVEWQQKVIQLKETYTSLDGRTMVSYASVKPIQKEYRYFVIDGHIVGSSVYKVGNRVFYDAVVDDEATMFAKQMIDLWQPARAYVLDVALTENGMRVIEINCINSAGFYAIDVAKFVMAIEDMIL